MFSLPKITAVLAIAATASAHGYISSINAGGTEYRGFDVKIDGYTPQPPESIAWSTSAKDEGYVANLHSEDIVCHRGAIPGVLSAPVAAGDVVKIHWSASWPADHYGPVLTYLANCNGDCSSVDKNTLEFFKIDEVGYTSEGTWGSDILIANGKAWDVTIPANLKAGGYVLRHEIIALHSAGTPQPYPQCVNLEITGGGDESPEGVLATQLYQASDPGMAINIWQADLTAGYKIPGPALYSDTKEQAPAEEDPAATTTPAPTTTAPLAESTLATETQPPESTTYSPESTGTSTENEVGTESPTACPADQVETTSSAPAPTATYAAEDISSIIDSLMPTTLAVKVQNVEYFCTRAPE
ncbi:glycosyl hydrolase family 61-domain-containing protein [Aspergillus karnatakaensis]|uniref:lytic polysaccharide monooxygenase auxiliary activity family 9 protein n=1 Tax=Aspergillus karnatakaensis TaxID=1810916 RepID=UPI003CCD37BE